MPDISFDMSLAPLDMPILVLHDPSQIKQYLPDGSKSPYEQHRCAWGAHVGVKTWAQVRFGGGVPDNSAGGGLLLPDWWFFDDGNWATPVWPIKWCRLPDYVLN